MFLFPVSKKKQHQQHFFTCFQQLNLFACCFKKHQQATETTISFCRSFFHFSCNNNQLIGKIGAFGIPRISLWKPIVTYGISPESLPTQTDREKPWLPGIGRSFRDAKGVEVVLLEGAEALERNEEVETEVLDLRQAGERFFF